MHITYNRLSQYLSLAALTLLTVAAIYAKQISVFYLLYLFWWDELIKTMFCWLRYKFKNDNIQNRPAYISSLKSRFFMLMVYVVFIVILFGLVINWNDNDLVLINLQVLFFQNSLFNFSLMTFLLRELYLYRYSPQPTDSYHIISTGIITLHLSVILGIFLWFFVTKKFTVFEDYAVILSILPFLLLRVIFEVMEIKSKTIETSSEF